MLLRTTILIFNYGVYNYAQQTAITLRMMGVSLSFSGSPRRNRCAHLWFYTSLVRSNN